MNRIILLICLWMFSGEVFSRPDSCHYYKRKLLSAEWVVSSSKALSEVKDSDMFVLEVVNDKDRHIEFKRLGGLAEFYYVPHCGNYTFFEKIFDRHRGREKDKGSWRLIKGEVSCFRIKLDGRTVILKPISYAVNQLKFRVIKAEGTYVNNSYY